ncbi:AMP-binding protein [Gordonibacter pamelaeae]
MEAVISKCRGVKSAIVILHGKGETASLRAAIVLDPDATLSEKELIHQQSAALPSAAICTTFAFVESLPVNANGKIDRKAVAEMLATIGEAKAPADPPRKGIESEVASLWSRILETETPGRRESFFSLGGDSLLGTRLIAELRKDGKMATLADLFEAPVLCDFCQRLSAEEQKDEWIIDANDTNKYAPFPLTSVQKAYLVGRDESLDLGGIDCTFYREYKTENLDEKRLERVIHQIIARHPMLRAQITEGSQCILKNVPNFLIEHYDTPDSMFESMARKSFNPSSWPLFALGIAPDLGKTRLGIVFDSIVMDATSVLLFLQELEDGYSGRTALKKSPSLTFRDYVLHAVSVEQDSSKSNVRFSEKEPLPPAPELPLAVDPSTIRHPRFCRLATEVDRNLEELSSICSRNHVTVPALLFACYSETLRRFSGTDALTVTVTTFDRRPIHPDVDKVIGDFTTLMRIAYCSDGTEVWSDRVRSATRKLAEGLDDRLGLTVADAEEPRASSHGYPVVFTAALGVEDKFAEHGRVFGQYVRGLSQTPQTWLDCQASKSEGKIILNWDYVEGLFPRGFLEEAFAYFKSLVEWSSIDENWAATPPEPLDLAIVRSERSTAIKRKTYETLHEGFFAYAEREPDRIALAFGNEQVTYSALRDLALRIAGKLQKDGCSIGSSVVVNTSNFVFRTASALGSLAAGAVYIPIGPDQPDIRTKSIISLCSPNALLTDEHVSEMNSWAPLSPNHIVADKDLAAYTIFTSGTTGEPKGIKISHAQAMCTVNAVSQFCPANPRTLSVSACDFDLSIFDIFGTLSTGGMIVSAETEDRRDSQSFVEAASKWRATVWNSVPALLEMALEVSDSNDLESMETILVSGDKVPLDLLARVKEKAPHARLIAMGGATECSIWSNWFDPEEEPGWESASPAWASMPYGRPLPRQEFFVEGKTGEVCPIWTTGELVISGDAVGLGYINASGGFFDVEGKRCYKTGDIGRVRPGGIIEILGRQDNQIKIGGSRIELGEIESAAEQCQGIGKAVAGQITSSSLGKGIGLVVERTFDALTPPGNLKIEVAPCCAGTDSLDKDEVVSTIKNTIQALADQNFPAEFELLKTTWEAWMASNHETTSVKADLDTVSLLIRIIKGEAPISEIEGSKKLNPESQILSTKSSASALLVMKDIAAEAASTSLCALDSSKEIIEVVTEDASLCTFFPGANTPTIEEKASFDMVLAPFSMHRFSSRIAALKRARALMKPEGHLVMSEFDRLSPAAMLSTVVMSKGQLNPESIKERSSTICPAQLWVEDAATCGLSFVRGCKLEGGSYVLVFSREENGETTERDMREWLSLRLPPSHMPRSITFVDSLPLSRNGKIDRALALKIAEKSKSKTRNEPREGLEAAIALIFGEALSSSALDRKASIFELGGDSLSAAKISRAIQLKICPDITLREVLDNPSVEGVASVLSLKHGIFAVEFEEGEI